MARVRRSGKGGACPAGHAGKGCVGGEGATARGSTRGARGRARVCGDRELCEPVGKWCARGRCEQRPVMMGVGGGEVAEHDRYRLSLPTAD